jgi:parallel beta-helix repeat protein
MKLKVLAFGALALAFGALSMVTGAYSAGRPVCLVSNERTGIGARSLQEAIDAANPGDTLVVKGTCVGFSTIDKNLTLKGVRNEPFGEPTLDGSGTTGVLAIAGCCTSLEVAVDNLTITRSGGDGICLCGFADHTLTLSRTTVSDNAGIAVTGIAGTVTLIDSTVRGNGDGLFAGRTGWTLVRSRVLDNRGVGIGVSRGFASLTDSTVSNNGRGISGSQGSLEISGSIVSDNHGPGITLFSDAGLSLVNSTVSGNTTSGSGGGIHAFEQAVAVLVDATITGNTAGLDGGGISIGPLSSFTVTNSTVTGNTASRNGGGIYITGDLDGSGNLTLADSTVSGNTATSGGGIFNDGITTLVGTNTIINNTPNDCVGVAGC